MRDSTGVKYLLGDHLGSTSVVANTSGIESNEVRYKPWGEDRYSYGSLPTTFRFTGQRVESSIGLYYYGARWYDAGLGRFVSADTIVAGGVQGFDRYSYVRNNPLRYIDPSGHRTCSAEQAATGDETCDQNITDRRAPLQPFNACSLTTGVCISYDGSSGYDAAIQDGSVDSLSRGQEFVLWLQEHPGWWSVYMNSSEERMWEFLIALAYAYETSGTLANATYQALMPIAFANKLDYLVNKYGSAGYYIFLGSMHSISLHSGKALEPRAAIEASLENAFNRTAGIWDGSLRSNDPNAPFDFANPMPGKQPADLLTSLYDYAASCQNKINGCDTTGIAGTLYVLASWSATDGVWNVVFIVSYSQWISWK